MAISIFHLTLITLLHYLVQF